MLDELKSRASALLSRSDVPLSIRPEAKSIGEFNLSDVGAYEAAKRGRMFHALGGGMRSWAGETVSLDAGMALSVVYACNKIISETKGFVPMKLRQRKGKYVEDATWHPMYRGMLYGPNAEITGQGFGELLTSHCVMRGNAYAQVVRRSGLGTAIEMNYLLPDNVRIDREKTGQRRLVYTVREPRQPDRTYTVQRDKPQDILHVRGLGWDGLRGYSVLAMARQSMGTAIAQERNVAKFYENGGRVPYTLEMEKHFSEDSDYERFRKDWRETYSDPHAVPILTDGLKYNQIGLSAADAQLLESRQFTIPELCRWFGVSPHLVGDLSRATFSNIASLAEQFQRFTMLNWTTRWEQEGYRCILTPEEQADGYFWEHDYDAFLAAEFQQRMVGYAQMLQNGVSSINEVRGKEGMNPVDGGDEHYVQVNLAAVGDGTEPKTSSARVRVAPVVKE